MTKQISIHEHDGFLSDLQALMEIRYGIKNPDAFIMICDSMAKAFRCEDPMYCGVAKNYGRCDSCRRRSEYEDVRGDQPSEVKLNPGHWPGTGIKIKKAEEPIAEECGNCDAMLLPDEAEDHECDLAGEE